MTINTTPHEIKVGEKTFQPSGLLLRLQENNQLYDVIDSLPIVKTEYFTPSVQIPEQLEKQLKEHEPQTLIIICSGLLSVLETHQWKEVAKPFKTICPTIKRIVFVSPDTGPDSAVRDKNGKIIGVKRCRIIKDFQEVTYD